MYKNKMIKASIHINTNKGDRRPNLNTLFRPNDLPFTIIN